jgi:hypothetical protein
LQKDNEAGLSGRFQHFPGFLFFSPDAIFNYNTDRYFNASYFSDFFPKCVYMRAARCFPLGNALLRHKSGGWEQRGTALSAFFDWILGFFIELNEGERR